MRARLCSKPPVGSNRGQRPCEWQLWRPAQVQLRDKQFLVQPRFAKEDGLLELMDNRAHAGVAVDQALGDALIHSHEEPGMLLQPRPRTTQVYSLHACTLVQLLEPVEFARVGVSCDRSDVLTQHQFGGTCGNWGT